MKKEIEGNVSLSELSYPPLALQFLELTLQIAHYTYSR